MGHSSQAYILKTELARKRQLPPPRRDPRRTYHNNRNREVRRQKASTNSSPRVLQIEPPVPQASASLPAIPTSSTPSIVELPALPIAPPTVSPFSPSVVEFPAAGMTPAFQEVGDEPSAAPLHQLPVPVPQSLPLLAIMPSASTSSAISSSLLPYEEYPSTCVDVRPSISSVSSIATVVGVSDPALAWRYNHPVYFPEDEEETHSAALDFMFHPPMLWPATPPAIDRAVLHGVAGIHLNDQWAQFPLPFQIPQLIQPHPEEGGDQDNTEELVEPPPPGSN